MSMPLNLHVSKHLDTCIYSSVHIEGIRLQQSYGQNNTQWNFPVTVPIEHLQYIFRIRNDALYHLKLILDSMVFRFSCPLLQSQPRIATRMYLAV